MKVFILCDSENHPIFPFLKRWGERRSNEDLKVKIVQKKEELDTGDLLFLVSCNQIITEKIKKLFKYTLVIHASDLPLGRGWSPHIWQILEGKDDINVTLLEAAEPVDSGRICKKTKIFINKTDLFDEINDKLFNAELELMDYAIENLDRLVFHEQSKNITPTYYKKRTPDESELDASKTIEDQFDLLRVSDPVRYPAFFTMYGKKFKIKIERLENEDN